MATGHVTLLLDALQAAGPLADVLIDERLANLPPADAALAAAVVVAAQPAEAWEPSLARVAHKIGVPDDVMRDTLLPFIRAWNHDPTRVADQQLAATTQIRDRLHAAAIARRWEPFAASIDPRLTTDPRWRDLAATLHDAQTHTVDVPNAVAVALEDGPLDPTSPAADLAERVNGLVYPAPPLTEHPSDAPLTDPTLHDAYPYPVPHCGRSQVER